MKILVDNGVLNHVFVKLNIEYVKDCEYILKDVEMVQLEKGGFYLREVVGINTKLIQVSISERNVWELEKLQTSLYFEKKAVKVESGTLVEIDSDTLKKNVDNAIWVYYKHDYVTTEDIEADLDEIVRYKNKNLQLSVCDVYLLIPGKIEDKKGIDTWYGVDKVRSHTFDVFRRNINYCVEEEYNTEFAKQLTRKCLGKIKLEINDIIDGEIYAQEAVLGIVHHSSGFCILEIIVQNCYMGGNKLLNYYCGEQLYCWYEGKRFTVNELLEHLSIIKCGKKRSMVFMYEDAPEEHLVNALANEELPMGKIGGYLLEKVKVENIAQYDTAQVYVSSETMLEKCNQIENQRDNRLSYNAIEIFFVELIIFQDASIDKVYKDLQKEEERQLGELDLKSSVELHERISFDMSLAMRFANYEQFRFPTVRESARRVAENFGIAQIYDKYAQNKELLEAMINANKRKIEERDNGIKNGFLLLLSALATVGTLGEVIYALISDTSKGLISYSAALVIVVVFYGIYKGIAAIVEKIDKKRKMR